VIEAIHAGNNINLPGLATTETVTQHVNLNYFSEAVSWEGEARLADADSWRITSLNRKLRTAWRGRATMNLAGEAEAALQGCNHAER